jgi:hypothetical protein
MHYQLTNYHTPYQCDHLSIVHLFVIVQNKKSFSYFVRRFMSSTADDCTVSYLTAQYDARFPLRRVILFF